MKKTILILSLTLFQSISFSQIEAKQKPKTSTIGEVKSGLAFIANLSSVENPGDIDKSTYCIDINNLEYSHINDIKTACFVGKQTLDDLYDIFKSAFTNENKKNKDFGLDFKLGNSDCRIRNTRMMGVTSLVFYIESGYCYLTEKQVDKLFGRD